MVHSLGRQHYKGNRSLLCLVVSINDCSGYTREILTTFPTLADLPPQPASTSPWFVDRLSSEAEGQSPEYMCWLYSIGNSYLTMNSKWESATYMDVFNVLGRPFALIDCL